MKKFENITELISKNNYREFTGWNNSLRVALDKHNYPQEEWKFTRLLYIRISQDFSESLISQLQSSLKDLSIIINVGKYKGYTLKYIKENNIRYYNWMVNSDFKNKPKVIQKPQPIKEVILSPSEETSDQERYLCYYHLDWVTVRNKDRICMNCLKSNMIPKVVALYHQKLLKKGIFIL